MQKFISALTVSAVVCLTAPLAFAQEAPAVDENGLSLGEEIRPEPQLGDRYIAEVHGDWAVRCTKTDAERDPCHMYQLMRDGDGNPVAEVNMSALPGGGRAVAGANIITPLGTLLTAQLALAVDTGTAKRYPFSFCEQIGCVARIGLTAEDLAAYKRGNAARVIMVPAGAPDKPVETAMSLSGFTAAFDALSK